MAWIRQVTEASRCIELGFVLGAGMPRVSGVPPLVIVTGAAHDDSRLADGTSGCNETLLVGTHAGTHVDGLTHVSRHGVVHGGRLASDVQTDNGIPYLDVTTIAPFVCPGFLVDLPAKLGSAALEQSIGVGPELLADLVDRDLAGSVVLLRTGWGRFWTDDPKRYASLTERRPGFTLEGARWLADRGVRAVGSDSFTIEVARPPDDGPVLMPAHMELLLERGVHVFEALNLEELAAAAPSDFLFLALPLRIVGGTGSPVRPVALI